MFFKPFYILLAKMMEVMFPRDVRTSEAALIQSNVSFGGSRDLLLAHKQLMEEAVLLKVNVEGVEWALKDVCQTPKLPPLDLGEFTDMIVPAIKTILPCFIASPLDCFWEGSTHKGPNPPLDIGDEIAGIGGLPSRFLSWRNLNPSAMIDGFSLFLDLSPITNEFERTNVGSGYQNRPCIDILDPECPKTVPNFVDHCVLVNEFMNWNMIQGNPIILPEVNSTAEEETETGSDYEDYGMFGGLFGSATGSGTDEDTSDCSNKEFVIDLLRKNSTIKFQLPSYISTLTIKDSFAQCKPAVFDPDMTNYFTPNGHWKKELISSDNTISSVILLSSPQSLFKRFGTDGDGKPGLDKSLWTLAKADNVLESWKKAFEEFLARKTGTVAKFTSGL